MSWKLAFNQGVSSFQESRLHDALEHFTQATTQPGGDKQYIVYDSRAAVYEKLQRHKDALLDARTVIKLAPDQWHGYARAARLFLLARRLDATLTMANMALDRLKPENVKRRAEMEQIRQQVAALQGTISGNHIAKVPVELFGVIFRIVVDSNQAFLVTLLHVCRFWRDVVLCTPSLWSILVLSQRRPLQKLRFWLKHSRGVIHHLKIGERAVQHVDWPFEDLDTIPWHNLLSCTVASWDIGKYLDQWSSSSHQQPFARLEEFVVQDRCSDLSLYSFLATSKLRSLEFRHADADWKLITTYLRDLTSLKIIGACANFHLAWFALQAFPSLTTFILDSPNEHKWRLTEPALVLSQLTHMELSGSWASSLLEAVVLPAIEVLNIRGSPNSLDQVFTAFARRSSCLKHLALYRVIISPSVLVGFIRRTPKLTTLELVSLARGTNFVVEALASPIATSDTTEEEPAFLCPALVHLNVSSSPDLRTGPLVRLVKSRLGTLLGADSSESQSTQPTCSKILSLTLDNCEQVEAEWLPWFKGNVSSVSCVYQTKKGAVWRR